MNNAFSTAGYPPLLGLRGQASGPSKGRGTAGLWADILARPSVPKAQSSP